MIPVTKARGIRRAIVRQHQPNNVAVRSRLAWFPRPARSASPSTSARCTDSERESATPSPAWSEHSARQARTVTQRPCVAHAVRDQHTRRRVRSRSGACRSLRRRRSGCGRDRPATVDRWLGRPDVVHGTNYVVPPTRCPSVVSVYDCWFLEHPRDVDADVRRAAAVLRRSVADGAHVVTSSAATTTRVRQLLATDRVHTIHLGPPPVPTIPADDRPTTLPDLGDGPFILSLGTIERRKNIPTLVAAFGRLAREHEHVKLVIAGAPGNDAVRRGPRDQPARQQRQRVASSGSGPSPTSRRRGSSPTPERWRTRRSTRDSASRSSRHNSWAPRSWRAPPARFPRSPGPPPC